MITLGSLQKTQLLYQTSYTKLSSPTLKRWRHTTIRSPVRHSD